MMMISKSRVYAECRVSVDAFIIMKGVIEEKLQNSNSKL